MWIKTKLLFSKPNPINSEGFDFSLRDFYFNTKDIVTIVPIEDEDDVPLIYKRYSSITLTDGREYSLQLTVDSIVELLKGSSEGGQLIIHEPNNIPPTKPNNALNITL